MSTDGTYGFVYCGAISIGLGVFTVANGVVRGSDYGGGRYDGAAQENADGTIDLTLSFEVAPGMILVQGTAAQDIPHTRQINARHVCRAILATVGRRKLPRRRAL
jgi:hypothetical protein